MSDIYTVNISEVNLIILIIIIIIVIIQLYILYINVYNLPNIQNIPNNNYPVNKKSNNSVQTNDGSKVSKSNIIISEITNTPNPSHYYNTDIANTDAIREYDYRKLNDPLENPARRIARHELPPIDYPTRGYSDNFTQIGILTLTNHKHDHTNNRKNNRKNKYNSEEELEYNVQSRYNENKILRLFGRQEYPRSDRYEYYTMINSGLDRIKIPLNTRRRELYNDDIVYIPELNTKYVVRLYDYDMPKYYPDII
jgi:hypothetical protein